LHGNETSTNVIHAWRRQARTGALSAGRSEAKVRFAPVAIVPVATSAMAREAGDAALIEVVLRNGRVLRLCERATRQDLRMPWRAR